MDKRQLRWVIIGAAVVAAALLGLWLGGVLGGGARTPAAGVTTSAPADDARANDAARADQTAHAQAAAPHNGTFLDRIFGAGATPPSEGAPPESLPVAAGRILFRLGLAALLAAALAFRPRRGGHLLQRNPFVAQTEILLAVVASALMMIVGDSAARAFGIFAAASLVRFRTNISDPKEITVLLIGLSIGLATGVGHWELAVLLAVFMLGLLWLLESYEPEQVTRPMELSVTTRNLDRTQSVLKQLFRRYQFNAEVRQLDRESDEAELGRLVYFVNVGAQVSTDLLSSEILAAASEDIDAIEWQQSKGVSYIYK
ncbi:MAG TPA: DUF4956 domain-containing protein [Pyrinomonadaceae bacterium]|jgi:hypothetical protein